MKKEQLKLFKEKIDKAIYVFSEDELVLIKNELSALETSNKDYYYYYYYYYLCGYCCECMACIYFQKKMKPELIKISEEGKEYLEKSIAIKNDFFDAHRSLGQTAGYACMGDPFTLMKNVSIVEREIKVAKPMINSEEDNKMFVLWECYKMIATPKLFGGNPEGAFKQLYHMRKHAKADVAAAYQGLALKAVKKINEAQKYFKQALKINPKNLIALINIGG